LGDSTGNKPPPDAYAIAVGKYNYKARYSLDYDAFAIIQPHGNPKDKKFHRISTAISLDDALLSRIKQSRPWYKKLSTRMHLSDDRKPNIRIGGPKSYKRKRCGAHQLLDFLLEPCDDCQWVEHD